MEQPAGVPAAPPAMTPVGVPQDAQPQPASTVPVGVLEDANSGRGWLAPTALTPPKGTWTFSDYELFVVGGSYAPTDNLQISASTLVPLTSDIPFLGLFSAKLRVGSAGNLHVAAAGSLFVFFDSSDDVSAGTIGGTATLCLDDGACRSHVTGYLAAGFASADQTAVPFLGSVAAAFGLTRRVKLVLEADTGFVAGEINDVANGFLGWYGLRFTSSAIGVDLGFVRPFGEDIDPDGLVLGFPFVSFTYRALPGA